jgi:hypothetical protein
MPTATPGEPAGTGAVGIRRRTTVLGSARMRRHGRRAEQQAVAEQIPEHRPGGRRG